MATPKRNYSFGLISRLALIGAFVGLGSWAVFNSKFKKHDPEEVARNDEQSENEEGNGESSDDSDAKSKGNSQNASKNLRTSAPSKAQPATYLDKSKPPKIKLEDNKKATTPPSKTLGNSDSFLPSKSKSKLTTSPPPSSFSFGSSQKSDSNNGFSPPSSSSFAPGKSTPGKSTPVKSTSSKTIPAKKQDDKKGPPSSNFNAGSSFSAGANTKTDSNSGARPPSSFSFSSQSKESPSATGFSASPGKNTGGFSSPKKSTVDNSSRKDSKSVIGSSGPPSATFNPSKSSGVLAGQTKKSAPQTTFDPRGSFQSPASKSGFGQSNSNDASKSVGSTNSGGFQSKSSSGQERPLRSVNNSGTGNSKSSTAPPNTGFSLSSDNRVGNSFSNNKSSTSGSSNNFNSTRPGSNPQNLATPNNTSPSSRAPSNAFGGGNAFQDKGSKPLPKKDPPKTNGVVKSQGNSGIGRSGTGFADIGKSDSPIAKSGTNLDPGQLQPRSKNDPGQPAASKSEFGGLGSRTKQPGSDTVGNRSPAAKFSSQSKTGGNPTKFAANPNFRDSVQTGVDDRKPGPSSLEGLQAPAVTLQKLSPREIQVSVESDFQLVLRNVGRATATNVMVVDPIPDGTEFIRADPPPTDRGTDGSLIWKFGELSPNQQKIIKVTLLPKRQGEIGSVARMSFQAAATAKSVCTKPELSITHSGPQKILKGKSARYVVIVQNNGDGAAKNVVIEDEVPVGFAFGNGKGSRLAYELGNLPPGARREVQLNLRAVETGRYENEIRVKMGKKIAANHKLNLEVVAPKLNMEIVGPTRRYIQREAKYSVEVENTGTASAKNVLMVTRLPKGLRFVKTNNQGQYNPREHSVYWSMVELSPQAKGKVELTLMPVGTGQQEIEFESRSMLDRTKLKKFPVVVDQLAELFFEVDDRDDPIEVNGETEYRIRVVNQGSKAATNVQINVEMPIGIQATDTKGPSKGSLTGQKVVFVPIASLAPRGELIYRIKAKGTRDGDHLIKVLLSSNERREAVAKQESTKVYSEYR